MRLDNSVNIFRHFFNAVRDDSGRWRSYRVTGGDVIITTTTPTPTIPTRNPNEVDDNNNAAIDNLNNQRNNQNVNNNDIVNKQNNEFNHPPESLYVFTFLFVTVTYATV